MAALKYQVQEMIFDSKSMLDEQNFYHQRQGAPDQLTKKLTYIMGDHTKNYPISTMTLGAIGYSKGMGKSAIELQDIQFTYPVMGRDTKVSILANTTYSAGDKPGIGHGEFYLYFNDNWLKRHYIIQSEGGIQAYILKDPELEGNLYKYTCQLDPALATDFCPLTELQAGTKWIELHTANAESQSRTTESNMVMPGAFKNQMTVLRHGMSWAGNAANKVMKITVKGAGGKETSVWMDYFMWQFEKSWLDQCEHLYWYSKYNRLADGNIPLKDLLTGKVIPRGSGILEQIQNKGYYTRLTYDILTTKIGSALFGQSDTDGMSITLFTGKGGMREFDRAMKEAGAKILTDFTGVAEKFVTGAGRDLMLGGFFSGMYHIDGYLIKVKHNPIFDMGKVAVGGKLHPETLFPLESYRMVFIDDADSSGTPNIQHVAQTGRSFLDGVIPGIAGMPKSLQIKGGFNSELSGLLTTDVDESAYTRLKTAGICMLRGNRSFDLQCTAGL